MPEWVLQGRYRPHRVIGRGALAEVWRATDLLLGRDVAVKLFLPRPGGPGEATVGDQSVEGEISALAQLSHPNIVPLYDTGQFRGEPFVVMPLIEGPSLAHHLALYGPLPPHRVASLGAGLASALACVHQHGIVHRDVKPANILLDEDGAPLLADFGVALPIAAEPVTATGHTVGTAFYMAPEQVRGERTGPAADIYALGLVLLECLTGHREYEGRPLDAAVERLTRAPVVPAGLPDEWRTLLESMVSVDPVRRPTADTVTDRCAVLATEADAAEVQPVGFLDTLFPAPDSAAALAPTDRPPTKVTTERARHRTRTVAPRRHRRGATVVAAAAALIVVAATFGIIRPESTSGPAVESVSKPPRSTAGPALDAAKDAAANDDTLDLAAGDASAQTQAAPATAVEPPVASEESIPSQPVAQEPEVVPAAAPHREDVVVTATSSETEPARLVQADAHPSRETVNVKVKVKVKVKVTAKDDHGNRGNSGNARKGGEKQASAGHPGKGLGKGKGKD